MRSLFITHPVRTLKRHGTRGVAVWQTDNLSADRHDFGRRSYRSWNRNRAGSRERRKETDPGEQHDAYRADRDFVVRGHTYSVTSGTADRDRLVRDCGSPHLLPHLRIGAPGEKNIQGVQEPLRKQPGPSDRVGATAGVVDGKRADGPRLSAPRETAEKIEVFSRRERRIVPASRAERFRPDRLNLPHSRTNAHEIQEEEKPVHESGEESIRPRRLVGQDLQECGCGNEPRILFERPDERADEPGGIRYKNVRIYEEQGFAGGHRRTPISCRGNGVGLVAAFFRHDTVGEFPDYRLRPVGRAVVRHDDFERGLGLG